MTCQNQFDDRFTDIETLSENAARVLSSENNDRDFIEIVDPARSAEVTQRLWDNYREDILPYFVGPEAGGVDWFADAFPEEVLNINCYLSPLDGLTLAGFWLVDFLALETHCRKFFGAEEREAA